MMRTMLGLVSTLLLVGGCAIGRSQTAQTAKTAMLGMPAERVLQCMGAPEHEATAGATTVWSYLSGNGHTDQDSSLYLDKHGNGWGTGSSRTRFCRINIVMQGQSVTAVQYSGPSGGLATPDEQCAFAVRRCVDPS